MLISLEINVVGLPPTVGVLTVAPNAVDNPIDTPTRTTAAAEFDKLQVTVPVNVPRGEAFPPMQLLSYVTPVAVSGRW